MALRFLDEKTQRFYFTGSDGGRESFVLIYGDEVDLRPGDGPSGAEWEHVVYRGRDGETKGGKWTTKRALEMYFLDVGQGDAAFIVTPRGRKILVDGGLRDRALGFLIWKYGLDKPGASVHIDQVIVSHGDADHIDGMVSIINHPRISVGRIVHNGIGVYSDGFDTPLGDRDTDGDLVTLHSSVADLGDANLGGTFGKWIEAIRGHGISYASVDAGMGSLDIDDPAIEVELLGPVLRMNRRALPWLGSKSKTINGHSVVFRLVYRDVRAFFSGDLNTAGSGWLLDQVALNSRFDAHILKAPHHGSHDFEPGLFDAVKPMITVVSSGDSPDHGHPRAQFLGAIGLAGRGAEPLVFATEIAATFADSGDDAPDAAESVPSGGGFSLGDLDFSKSEANTIARRRFKQTLPGIINVRTDGREMYAARRVMAGYQWESYGPIAPVPAR